MLSALLFSSALASPIDVATPLCTDPLSKCLTFDASKYTGKWYEIGGTAFVRRIEGGLSCIQAKYSAQPDGTIGVVNTGIKDGKPASISGSATQLSPSELQVTFPGAPSFPGPNYVVLNVWQNANGYARALVVAPKRGPDAPESTWILARASSISDAEIEESLDYVRKAGYNPEKNDFQKIDQSVATCGAQ